MRNLKNGVHICLENAQKLIEDAELLFEHESYGHATSLALIGIEEMAKALVLSEAYFSNRELEHVMDVFYRHRVKNAVFLGAIVAMYAPIGTRKTNAEKKALTAREIQKSAAKVESPLMKVLQEVDELRKVGLYVDYKKERWCSPVDIIREEAKFHVEFGKRFLAELSSKCKMFIEHASIRPQLYLALRARAKEDLDEGRISPELYNILLCGLED
ncbi:MAG: AbiV family abortive infection protein [Candidatus Bathyarchaeia archaeon]